MVPSHRIFAELDAAAAHQALVRARLALWLSWAATLATAALALALAQWGHVHAAIYVLGLGVPGVFGTGLGAAYVCKRRDSPAHPSRHRQALRLLGRYAPGLHSAVRTALELGDAAPLDAANQSQALAEQHLETTAERLFAADIKRRWWASQRRAIALSYGALAACMLLSLGCGALYGRAAGRIKQALLEPHAWRLSDQSLVDNLSLRYTYPAYTQASPRTVDGSDGAIEAVEGTQIDMDVHATRPLHRAFIDFAKGGPGPSQRLDAAWTKGNQAHFSWPLQADGAYRFVFDFGDGDALGDASLHAVHVVPDAAPAVAMTLPFGDVVLRQMQPVQLAWRAQDDFNLQEARLLVERPGKPDQSLMLWSRDANVLVQTQADGRYSWDTTALHLAPGEQVRFCVAASDTDSAHGPKRGVSASRKLTLYSARAHHEELIAKCRAALDGLVDALGLELEAPIGASAGPQADWQTLAGSLQAAAARTGSVDAALTALMAALKQDPLAQAPIFAAFSNVAEHIGRISAGRGQVAALLAGTSFAMRGQRIGPSIALQQQYIGFLEGDIIYLDDLLATARIDEVKSLAKDLLGDQRDLKALLQKMQQTNEPQAQAQLTQGIAALREKMLDVLKKMSEIKQSLPGEYRNMEASTMLRLDEQLARLDQQLRDGKLDQAAQEIEQLANMVENMVQTLGEAQKQYGGARYDAMREQLQSFADTFRQLEEKEQSLQASSDALLSSLRQKAIEKMAQNQNDFVKKVRAQTHAALTSLDKLGQSKAVVARVSDRLEQSRQALLDVDSLLTHQDFIEGKARAEAAEDDAEGLCHALAAADAFGQSADVARAGKHCDNAAQKAAAVSGMLAQLFEDPETSLTPAQKRRLDAMAQKQQDLQSQTQKLRAQMQQMAGQMPLFGASSQQNLEQAGMQMQSAAQSFQQRDLARGAGQSKQAAEALGQLRQKLQEAARQSGAGGLPLPLGGPGPRPGSGQQETGEGASGHFAPEQQEEVFIPGGPAEPGGAQFRRDLMEAAKQKAPVYYQDAVRRYYNELIR